MLAHILPRHGIEIERVDLADHDATKHALDRRPRAVYLETPTNPRIHVLDVPSIVEHARAVGALVIVDSTFATPVLQNPDSMGRRSRGAQRDEIPRGAFRHRARRRGHGPDRRRRSDGRSPPEIRIDTRSVCRVAPQSRAHDSVDTYPRPNSLGGPPREETLRASECTARRLPGASQ